MRGMNIALIVVIVLVLGGLGLAYMRSSQTPSVNTNQVNNLTNPSPTTTTPVSTTVSPATTGSTANRVVVNLEEQSTSGQLGTATLEEVNGKVVVTVDITSGETGVAQPAHIHNGACPNPGAVKYPLTNVVNGKSTTTINATLAQLGDQLPLAINVHRSTSQPNIYIACGDIDL